MTIIGTQSCSKDGDGNYFATCQAPETVENRLRPDADGNFISITVLRVVEFILIEGPQGAVGNRFGEREGIAPEHINMLVSQG